MDAAVKALKDARKELKWKDKTDKPGTEDKPNPDNTQQIGGGVNPNQVSVQKNPNTLHKAPVPETGDNSGFLGYGMLLLAVLAGIFISTANGRTKKKQ